MEEIVTDIRTSPNLQLSSSHSHSGSKKSWWDGNEEEIFFFNSNNVHVKGKWDETKENLSRLSGCVVRHFCPPPYELSFFDFSTLSYRSGCHRAELKMRFNVQSWASSVCQWGRNVCKHSNRRLSELVLGERFRVIVILCTCQIRVIIIIIKH